MESPVTYDIIIVGAGIAGINAAYRIQTKLPKCSFVVLEASDVAGGTWNIFRYPGVRSDSDIHTYGFSWHPCHHNQIMLDGQSIFEYINSTATKYGIDHHIRYKHKVKKASWSSLHHLWTLTAKTRDGDIHFRTQFVVFATGYFDHQKPLPADISGLSDYKGIVVHPQSWPRELDVTGRRIAVIGSGATSISLIPKLAETARSVTMVQRSPGYILPVPSKSGCTWMERLPSARLSHKLKRYGWLAVTLAGYYICRSFPSYAKRYFLKAVQKSLPMHIPLKPHFEPNYKVWDQRLLACPDGDFFQSLHSGNVGVETSTIRTVTDSSIILDNGNVIETEIIVTATGLSLQFGGGIMFEIDGGACDLSDKFMWKGMMLEDIPNAFFTLGYLTNASWTLGTDITALFLCRLIAHMESNKLVAATTRMQGCSGLPRQIWNLNSTYLEASRDKLPKVGEVSPWRPRSNYILDYLEALYGSFGECMEFVETA